MIITPNFVNSQISAVFSYVELLILFQGKFVSFSRFSSWVHEFQCQLHLRRLEKAGNEEERDAELGSGRK